MLRPFGWQAVLAVWQFAPVVTGAVVVAAGLYLWGVRRVARRHPARPWPAWRTSMFLGGLAVVVLATESGIGSPETAKLAIAFLVSGPHSSRSVVPLTRRV